MSGQGRECGIEAHGACCCTCKHHLPDFHHCATAWELRDQHGGCVCSVQKGWACRPPEFDGRVFSGWTEHGLCEMHTPKEPLIPQERADG